MSEKIVIANPDVAPSSEQQERATSLLTEIIDSPDSIGASTEDGTYSKTQTENELRETIDVGSPHGGLKLKASRIREHDPERHLPGKQSETLTIYASIPDIAQVNLVIVDGKVWSVDYSDPFVTMNQEGDFSGLNEALDAIKVAVDELHLQTR